MQAERNTVSVNSVQLSWRSITLFLLTMACVVLCLAFIQTLLFSVVGAITLAVITRNISLRLRRVFSPTTTAILMVVLVTLAIIFPAFFIVRNLIGELVQAIRYIQSGGATAELQRISEHHTKFSLFIDQGLNMLAQSSQQIASISAISIGKGLRDFATTITDSILALFFYFFLVRDERAAVRALRSIVPLPEKDSTHLVSKLGDIIHVIFAGRLLIALIQGTLAGLAYWLLGVPNALLWAALTSAFCMVPAFGSFIVWVPIALYLGLNGSWLKAGILAAWGGIVIGNLDNFLYPILVGRKTDMHTAIIFISIFGGLAVFGAPGFVLGPVVVSIAMLLFQVWKKNSHTDADPV